MLWLYFIVPVLAAVITATSNKYSSNKELNKQFFIIGSSLLVLSIALQSGAYIGFIAAGQHDVEVINGQVLSKTRERVSCDHSYECNCHYVRSCTGSGSSRSCSSTRKCSTCYEHAYDVDWDVHTSVGDINIDRVDRRGMDRPPRWDIVKPGEPAAAEHSYMNYVLGNKDSLFSKDKKYAEAFKDQLPPYPEVYDYYRFNRVINLAGRVLPVDQWNTFLNDKLKTLGIEKQVNIILVLTSGKPVEFFNALIYDWSGGKKNDVIVVADIDSSDDINWLLSTSFADGMDNTQLHARNGSDFISKKFDIDVLSGVVVNIQKEFNRMPMEKMEYLKYRTLDTWEAVMLFFLGIIPFTGYVAFNFFNRR